MIFWTEQLFSILLFVTTRIHSVWEGNVFTSVCLSVSLLNSRVGGSDVNFAHDALGHSIAAYKSIMG